ncbi:MAG TPA: hypothetical protein DCW31_10555 [Lactobacillus sp.]|nr:hypothetical protein [Lactobacillus sp.]
MRLTIDEEVNRNFFNDMTDYVMKEGHMSHEKAEHLVNPLRSTIDTNMPYVQHTGPIYFAMRLLMREGIIPYKAI